MTMPTRLKLLAAFLPLLAGGSALAAPAYNAAGDLIPPADYREWVFLSAGLDMSYSESGTGMDHSMFDNVFVDPASWAQFKQTGHWPDKTMMVLESRVANSHGSINKHGQYQTEELMGTEIHVRDEARFKGGWGFFRFDGASPAKLIPYEAQCYACHQAHGAADTTFTQFYPTAKPIAVKAGNFREQ
jgi:hypothetical protein